MDQSTLDVPNGNCLQVALPLGPLGYILRGDGRLVGFGLLPPAVESEAVKDPETWAEVKVCPPANILEFKGIGLWQCPSSFCSEKIKKNTSYEAHIKKHLSLILRQQNYASTSRLQEDCEIPLPPSLQIRYYCNEQSCYSGLQPLDKSRGFTRLKYLKQHYLKVHAPKTFGCTACSKSFATLALLGVHMRNCGNSFECSTCPTKYPTLEALQTHCRRKDHTFDYSKYKDIFENAKQETSAIRQADKDMRQKLAAASESRKSLPMPAQFIIPRPKTITCGPGGVPSHITWTYENVTEGPKLKMEMSTQTEAAVTSPTPNTTAKGNSSTNRIGRRKRSAETQTSKYKVSTQTQTLNVTKRRRTSKKQTAEAKTQCSVSIPDPVADRCDNETNEIQMTNSCVEDTNDIGGSHSITVPVDTSDPSRCTIPLEMLMGLVGIDDSEELHRQTQTDPPSPLNTDLLDTGDTGFQDQDISDMMNFVTAETQTGFGISHYGSDLEFLDTTGESSRNSLRTLDSSTMYPFDWNTDSYPTTGSQTDLFSPYDDYSVLSPHEGNRNSPSYLETIDGVTQTVSTDNNPGADILAIFDLDNMLDTNISN